MHDTIAARGGKTKHGCHAGCIIQCSQQYVDEKGAYVTSGFEYETIWGFGANCCIDNLDQIALADNIMDDIGIDSIESAVLMGVAMEAGLLAFGDGPGVLRLLREEIGKATPLGRILGGGAASVGRTYGVTRVPVVKGQGIPAYDPRSVKGIGITYATSTMGADHTAGYSVATNILKVGGDVDPLKKEGQVELSRNLQIATAAVDSTGLCLFVAFPVLDNPARPDRHRRHAQRPLRHRPGSRRRRRTGQDHPQDRARLQPGRRLHQRPRPAPRVLQRAGAAAQRGVGLHRRRNRRVLELLDRRVHQVLSCPVHPLWGAPGIFFDGVGIGLQLSGATDWAAPGAATPGVLILGFP